VFWDCDDIPNPAKVLEMVVIADEVNSDVTLGEFQIIGSASENIRVKRILTGQKVLESVAVNPGLWRFAIKMDLTKNTRFQELSMAEDQIFLAEILAKSTHLTCFHETVYEYWNHPGGQLTKNKIKIGQLDFAIEHFYQEYKSTKCQPLLIAIIRLNLTALKKHSVMGKLMVLSKFSIFIISHLFDIKTIVNSFFLIWRLR
jgi:hypothetical protein